MVPVHLLSLASAAVMATLLAPAVTAEDPSTVALRVDALFNVDLAGTDNGGCGNKGRAGMQRLVDEATQLAAAGVWLVNDVESNVDGPVRDEASRLLYAWMKYNSGNNEQRETIRNRFKAVHSFLTTGQPAIPDGKPDLFCSASYAVRQSWPSEARDHNGNAIPRVNGGNLRIYELPSMDFWVNQAPNSGNVPFWSDKYKAYIMFKPKVSLVPGRPADLCTGILAFVNYWNQWPYNVDKPRYLTLCPRSYGSDKIRLGQLALEPKTFDEIARATREGDYSELQAADVLDDNEATTLYHELFHLVLGSADTKPAGGGEVYDYDDIMKLTVTDAMRNPESYSVAATAYWHTRRDRATNPDNPVEFWTGWVSREASG